MSTRKIILKSQEDLTNWLERWQHLHEGFIKSLVIQSGDVWDRGAQIKTAVYTVKVEVHQQRRRCELHFKGCREYSFAHEGGDDNTIFEVRGVFRPEIGFFFSFDPTSPDPTGDTSEDNDWAISEGLEVIEDT